MANEIVKKTKDLVSLVDNKPLGEIIKPLTKEIHLFDTYVAGTTHIKDESLIEAVKVGDKFSLRREDNYFDSNAILVLNGEDKKVGYVPEKDNIVFARLMDAGKLLTAKVFDTEQKGPFKKIRISIYLVDF